uniref:Heat shock protein 70 n=1 Tax=Panagrolaimus davidi TaxID=227884 RepID=A0A914P8U3_9BILA
MVFHIGIDVSSGNVAAYNDITKEIFKFKIEYFDFDNDYKKICEFHKIIKTKCLGDIGFVCFHMYNNYNNEIRDEFIKNGKEYGFKKVLIINSFTEKHLGFLINLYEKPKIGDIFWTFTFENCVIWEKTETGSKLIKILDIEYALLTTENYLLKLKQNVEKDPILVIIDLKYYGNFSDIVKNTFPKCKCILHKNILETCEISLIKARIEADDPDLNADIKVCDISNYINSTIRVTIWDSEPYNGVKEILYLEKGQILPFEKQLIIPVESLEQSLVETYDIPQEPLINPNINVVGIDLGMTRCCVAVNRTNGIELIAIDGSERQLPSYISFKEKDPICGQLVINQLEFYANSSVFDIKSIIGKNYDEIVIRSTWPFEVIKNDINKPLIRVQDYDGNALEQNPEEISAILLKHIKQKVEEFQGKEMDEVVITIPNGFNQNQKIATLVAADLAGFKTVHLLEEPIAASIAYFVNRPIPPNFNLLLFDLGGGTLDLCIFKVELNTLKITAKGGDNNLGGTDFDNLLFQHFAKTLETKHETAINQRNKYRLMQKCVEIKHTLSIDFESR